MPQTLPFSLVLPVLPEGWQGTPQDLLDFIQEGATIQSSGSVSFGGQIGGPRPTTNVGLFVYLAEGDADASSKSAQRFEYWDGSRYLPFPTVPIGGMIDWCSALSVLPDNYVEADGTAYLKTDYPELYTVFKGLYLKSTDDITTTFRVPDCRGRYTAGAGRGDYNPQAVASGWMATTGNTMANLKQDGNSDGTPEAQGPYVGWEWPTPKIPVGGQSMPPHPTLITLIADSKFAKTFPFTKLTTYYHGIRPPTLVTKKIIFAGLKRTS